MVHCFTRKQCPAMLDKTLLKGNGQKCAKGLLVNQVPRVVKAQVSCHGLEA
jgi:hypothetical protein